MSDRAQGESTTGVHGRGRARPGPLTTPIYQTSTFVLKDAADVDAVYEGRREGDVYSRFSNPTLASAADRVAALEGAEAGLVFASGMAAISAAVLAHVGAGGRIVANEDLYGGTTRLFHELATRFGVRVDKFRSDDADAMRALLREPADLLYVETPTNPTLLLVDLAAAAQSARASGTPSLCDSTFASPVNSKPLALGMDLVVHSGTKYLGGHADLTAGALAGSRERIRRVDAMGRSLGGTLDPHAAFLLERGMKTIALRVRACNANAQRVAEHLERHPAVRKVHYPGLPSHPQHALAKRQMPGGCGAVLSFDLASLGDAKRFLDGLRLVRNAASLGGVESLCSIPYQQSHRGQPPEVLARSGIVPGTVRLSVGVEDADDLLADLDQALAPLGKR
ncbi:MAG TPA: aminotransferase class I/II-fold pyridoxal phosphate-dependent enzyme [Candidatus Thermoplasmatota archaeon]|nr:aminotransferase class I/II-fold pyridoxal phosphate-dependent enzyme [Candidatus Thermoplasmatota archaeon]